MQISAGVSLVAGKEFPLSKMYILQRLNERSSQTDCEEKESRFLLSQHSLAAV